MRRLLFSPLVLLVVWGNRQFLRLSFSLLYGGVGSGREFDVGNGAFWALLRQPLAIMLYLLMVLVWWLLAKQADDETADSTLVYDPGSLLTLPCHHVSASCILFRLVWI